MADTVRIEDAHARYKGLFSDLKKTSRDAQQTLHPQIYTDPDFLNVELQEVFQKEWLCVGRVDEVPNKGNYTTTKLLGEPLIVVRSDEDTIKVLSNICRHRCMQVASGSGKTRGFSCPYHAWRYDLEGQLINAPLMTAENFSLDEHRLKEIKSEIWQGFIYVNLDGNAEPLSPRLTELDKILTNYHTDEMIHHFVEEDIWDANWKALVENFMEGYHLSFVHPGTLRPITPTKQAKKLPDGPGFTAYAADYEDGYAARRYDHKDLTEEERNRSTLFCVFPSQVVSQSPHLLVYMAIQPLTVNQLKIRWSISVRDSEMIETEFDKLLTLWKQVNQEDKVKLEILQQNLTSMHADTGPLAQEDLEGTIKDFHRYLAKRLNA
ncbi:aromatic ring-hydroxylating oxygenase subunit alpha [Curvivirga sp.]|uniref:aromatic ring-hydroxylating oxygenase subunit alpha n=1 Tax=Curvivirga sp. TaxID=2856848 RepID=UPI003B59BE50